MQDQLRELELLVKSRYGLIFLESDDNIRAESLLKLLSGSLAIPYFYWTRTKGLNRGDIESKVAAYKSVDLTQALLNVKSFSTQAIYHFIDLEQELNDSAILSLIKDTSNELAKNTSSIVITGNNLTLPNTLKPISAYFKIPEPDIKEYELLLDRVVRDLYARIPVSVRLSEADRQKLLNNLKGFTLTEAEKLVTKLIIEDGALSSEDVSKIIDAKKEIISRDGVLEYYPAEQSLQDIADLKTLKSWLNKRKEIIINPQKAAAFGLSFPKGVLLLGVPGCGKSLCAKAVAKEWGLPLLKMDPSNLYNKYIGESEKNFKRAISAAEKMAPVILWIDEIEKAFANSDQDGGTSTRIFGTFLSWLQDRKGDVFIVATANDITKLPPEFLRKGRFDEIFFVDLPDAETRNAIFEIHLKKRNKNPDKFDLALLVEQTKEFSGAEIEQVIVSSLYTAFSSQKDLDTAAILTEVSATTPLSITLAEKIDALRTWAKDRTVSAH